jgi:transcriptional regulator with XRE-family HTH domain
MADAGSDPELRQVRLQFAESVKTARKAARLSQAELGERLGRSQKYVSDIEIGERSLPLTTMATILRALGKNLSVEMKITPLRATKKVAKNS